ncbi:proline--tRNA ligase [archaeon]|jgi:prolyl-tRNA synthetase|nr:proline--tRNA ligase [archaeon]
MKYSNIFIHTQKESPKNATAISHDLSIRAGLMHQVTAGHYDFLPIGTKIVKKVENIVREEMNKAGSQEIIMPIMQPAHLWKKSERWDIYGNEMFKLQNRSKRDFCLGPTHEELIVDLVKNKIKTYKDLHFHLYQITTKFRDEKRPRGGLLRGREFLMKDAYSFDSEQKGLDETYDNIRSAYLKILKRCGVKAIPTYAEAGEMGGQFSEEFMAESPAGEDKFVIIDGKSRKYEDVSDIVNESEVKNGIEICHIFKLGTRYSKPMGLYFSDKNDNRKPVIMGCYGIGVTRMIPTSIEQNHDKKGIIWSKELAPFQASIIPINYQDKDVNRYSQKVYSSLISNGYDVILDDRNLSPGVKFKDSDLIGIPNKLIISKKNINNNQVEYENRTGDQKYMINYENLLHRVNQIL